ncbi:hypothetical protein HG536_0A00940 [Torulaspora globosa]|uniref:Cdc23 domain-containing protein n=1 Tax=Torulaspora globosa TaxID=48254 RepID=A0A7G3Z9U1_9SACH|nr:uncharacterized protein HG536_0A00940 [Torulaspora globosa]QLL30277.1 hypothetical protein HG536_0A00940 [Torulaspora globosa]
MNLEDQIQVVQDIRLSLRRSATKLSKLKLYKSSKWAAEALCGMIELSSLTVSDAAGSASRDGNDTREDNQGYQDFSELSEQEYDLYLLASTLFDCKEFDRCAFFLKDVSNPCLKFLKLYAEYLSWDSKVRNSTEDILTSGKTPRHMIRNANHANDSNRELGSRGASKSPLSGDGQQADSPVIMKELTSFLEKTETQETGSNIGIALLYYLKGILLKHDDNKSEASSCFLRSLSLYSYNWTCWVELLDCLSRSDESLLLLKHIESKLKLQSNDNIRSQSSIQDNAMMKFFRVALFQEFSGNVDVFLEELHYLHSIFPNFTYLKAQNALINYNYMDYGNAESLFDQIVKSDPYRLDDLDTYSNILYVMQKHSKLAYLAQFTSHVDKFRPETCCAIANYYSARQEHEKSIMYFRRALTLNRNCTSAWTLMGHEFVELRNSHAAIECYRRAVDINPKDFKAWYGLGQAYEVLDMYLYSLYYFQKACTLKPLDRRMWQALASCYSKVGNRQEAIKCYERALQLSLNVDQDSVLFYRLAELYEQIHDVANCKKFMVRCVDVEEATEGLITDETAKARLWLAKFEAKRKNYEQAYNYAVGVSHGTSQEIEEARSIARECRQRIQ